MTPGAVISSAGHAGLLVFALLGWGMSADPLEFEVVEVSVITGDQFDALTAQPEPAPPPEDPVAPTAPQVDETPPPPPAPQEAPPPEPVPQPAPPEPAPSEDAPQVTETSALPPRPEPDIAPAPDLVTPEPPSGAPDLAASVRPRPRPAPRVAPTPAPPPPPEAEIAETVQDAAVPDQPADTIAEDAQEATAPEAAAPEIVTEAEEPAGGAPTSSIRPPSRPSRPTATADAAEPETAEPATDSDAVADAVAAAVADTAVPETPAPQGPPLSGSEREGFRVAVQACWNVDVGSTSSAVTVTVGFNLAQNGRVEGDVRLIGAEGGDSAAQNAAYQAARRAVLRCQSDGYDLPADKYDQWKEVEMTFDPSGMRLR